ncbi:breast cancer type 1 susceptibility protein homolog [Plakobranchus ocellatus]|uniref:Breast cancer type 1 susceptibility protein homolog n=1 Tax=Plakobranchus ocellatus TaxID=259542 RepID=A0AAV4DDR4_9GAST|nr:breast cancer type 1 susceptibility protein homolog [Plakobranchus ocellatus]
MKVVAGLVAFAPKKLECELALSLQPDFASPNSLKINVMFLVPYAKYLFLKDSKKKQAANSRDSIHVTSRSIERSIKTVHTTKEICSIQGETEQNDKGGTACTQLDLANEKDLQDYLSATLAESASRKNRVEPKSRDSTAVVSEASKKKIYLCGEKLSNISKKNHKDTTSVEEEIPESACSSENKATKDKDKQDLLRYLEIGSCGAAWGSDATECENLMNNGSKADQALKALGGINKENEMDIDFCDKFTSKTSWTESETQNKSKDKPDLSPPKVNVKTRPMLKGQNSKFSSSADCHSSNFPEVGCNLSSNLPKNKRKPQTSKGIVENLNLADSETASVSPNSTKRKSVISRTYSKNMKAVFQTGGPIRNWVETLPSPHATAVGKKGSKVKKLSATENDGARKHRNSSTAAHENSTDANFSPKKNAIRNIKSVSPLPAPEIQDKRNVIFKSRGSEPDLNTKLVMMQSIDMHNDKVLDPYEFTGSQTPEGKAKKIRGRRGSSKKSNHCFDQNMQPPKADECTKAFQPSSCMKGDGFGDATEDLPVHAKGNIVGGQKQGKRKVHFSDGYYSLQNEHTSFAKEPSEINQSDHPLKLTSQVSQNFCLESCKRTGDSKISKESENLFGKKDFARSDTINQPESPHNDMSTEIKRIGDEVEEKEQMENSETLVGKKTRENDTQASKFDRNQTDKKAVLKIDISKHEELENIYEDQQDPTKGLGKKGRKRKLENLEAKNSYMVGKRTLTRRLRKADFSLESEMLKQEEELTKIIHKINEAEDHDLSFCTQEAYTKIQEEQAKQEEHKVAFGFELLAQVDKKDKKERNKGNLCKPKQCEAPDAVKCPNTRQIMRDSDKKIQSGKGNEASSYTEESYEWNPIIAKKHLSPLETAKKETLQQNKPYDKCSALKVSKFHHVAESRSNCNFNVNAISPNKQTNDTFRYESHIGTGLIHFKPVIKSTAFLFPRPNVNLMVEVCPRPSQNCVSNTPESQATVLAPDSLTTIGPVQSELEVNRKVQCHDEIESVIPSKIHASHNYNVVMETPLLLMHSQLQSEPVIPDQCKDAEEAPISVAKKDVTEAFLESQSTNLHTAYASHVKISNESAKVLCADGIAENNMAKKQNEAAAKISSESSPFHASEPKVTGKSDILAIDTCCLESKEGVRIDSSSTEKTHAFIRGHHSSKFTELPVIEETQGTDTCSPYKAMKFKESEENTKREATSTTSETETQKNVCLVAFDNNDGTLSHDDNTETKRVLSCQEQMTSQESCIIINSDTTTLERYEGNANASSSVLSQSILHIKRDASGVTSSSSTGSNAIIPPTSEKGLQVNGIDSALNMENEETDDSGLTHKDKSGELQGKTLFHSQINSAPARVYVSDSDDEDRVLLVRRTKRLCFSSDDNIVEPIVFNTSNKYETQTGLGKLAAEDMIGETQALNVLDTDSQDVAQTTLDKENVEDCSNNPDIKIIAETERDSVMMSTNKEKEQQSDTFVEVTPIGDVRYVEGVGRCFVGLDNSAFKPDFLQVRECQGSPPTKPEVPALGLLFEDSGKQGQISKGQIYKDIDFSKDEKLDDSSASERPSCKKKTPSLSSLATYKSVVSSKNEDLSGKASKDNKRADLNISFVESNKSGRTRRGLAAKIASEDKAQTLTLSDSAKAAICRSVQETKSKLEYLNSNKSISLSKSTPDIIDLDMEKEENNPKGEDSKALKEKMLSDENCGPKCLLTNEYGKCKIDYLLRKEKMDNVGSKDAMVVDPESKNASYKVSKETQNHLESDAPERCLRPCNNTIFSNTGRSTEAEKVENDQVMSDLKTCFVSSNDESSGDESPKKGSVIFGKNTSSPIHDSHDALEKPDHFQDKIVDKEIRNSNNSVRSSPLKDVAEDKCQSFASKQLLITAHLQNVVEESDVDADMDEEEEMVIAVQGKKRLRQQITSDSDESNEEEHSQSKSSVSSVLSSQAEILTTQQAKALEGDVDKLQKEIAIYEAKLGVFPPLDSNEDDEDDDEDENDDTDEEMLEAATNTDSASLCKRLPDVFVIDESPCTATVAEADDEEKSDDLFVSPPSPSPPHRRSKPRPPPPKRPKLNDTVAPLSDNFLKQFQSPGGTVRTKKQLDFVQSDLNNFGAHSKISSPAKNLTKEGEDLLQRPRSPVLSSQKTKLSEIKEAQGTKSGSVTNKNNHRQICFVTSGLTREDNVIALAFSTKLGVRFTSKFSDEVTHVVMKTESDESRACDRTLKFFQGIAHKCWVVSFSWVKSSLSSNNILPEPAFEICGDTSAGEFAGGSRLSRESTKPLFSDFSFACVGSSQEMPKESLSDLVTVCGASCVEDPIALLSKIVKHKVIIRCSDSDVEPSGAEIDMFNGLYKHMGLVTLMREWILDSLSSYTLLPMANYVLNTVDNVHVPF